MNHVKGPWIVKEMYEGIRIMQETGGGEIAELKAPIMSVDRANAHLIAAAPEMLEALKGMVEHFSPNIDSRNEGIQEEAIEHALAAIKKASGAS